MAEVKLKEETELWEPRGPCGSWGPAEDAHGSGVEPAHLKEEPELCIKQEPQEFPFHMVTVKSEDDEDKSSVLHQRPTEENREETNGAEAGCSSDPLTQFHSDSEEHTDSSEDTDHSEDYSQEQAPAKRSYAMVPPDAAVRDKRPHRCSECGKNYRWKSELQEHMLRHSGEKPHECPECGKKFIRKSALNRHMLSHTEVTPHKCPACEKSFIDKYYFTRHLRTLHHMCPVCEVCFPDKMHLKEHLKTHLKDRSVLKPYSCPECGRSYRWKSQLQQHMSSHSGEKPHECPTCGKKFRLISHFLEHKLRHSVQKMHKCPECEKVFRTKPDLKKHMLHAGKKPHKCSVCKKSFSSKSYLTRHLQSQHHKCSVCKDVFPDFIKLKEHLKLHVEDGAVDQSILKSCPACGKEFQKDSALRRHMMLHKQCHKCSLCEKRYSHKSNLTQHLKRVHHMFAVCGEQFPERITLDEHLKSQDSRDCRSLIY